jgi:hypothetical protein
MPLGTIGLGQSIVRGDRHIPIYGTSLGIERRKIAKGAYNSKQGAADHLLGEGSVGAASAAPFLCDRMFALLYDAREKVMLTLYSGVFSPDDIASLDEYVAAFIAREGSYVRNIFDFTNVEAFGISRLRSLERGRKLRTNPGQAGSSWRPSIIYSSFFATMRRLSSTSATAQ